MALLKPTRFFPDKSSGDYQAIDGKSQITSSIVDSLILKDKMTFKLTNVMSNNSYYISTPFTFVIKGNSLLTAIKMSVYDIGKNNIFISDIYNIANPIYPTNYLGQEATIKVYIPSQKNATYGGGYFLNNTSSSNYKYTFTVYWVEDGTTKSITSSEIYFESRVALAINNNITIDGTTFQFNSTAVLNGLKHKFQASVNNTIPLSYFEWILKDSYSNVIADTGMIPSQEMIFEYDGFLPFDYTLELTVKNIVGNTATSILIINNTSGSMTNLTNQLTLENVYTEGCIHVGWDNVGIKEELIGLNQVTTNILDHSYIYNTLKAINSTKVSYVTKDTRTCLKVVEPSYYYLTQFYNGKFEENTQYRFKISLFNEGSSLLGCRFYLRYTDGTEQHNVINQVITFGVWLEEYADSLPNKTIEYMYILYGANTSVVYFDINKFQIQKLSETTLYPNYYPYKELLGFDIYRQKRGELYSHFVANRTVNALELYDYSITNETDYTYTLYPIIATNSIATNLSSSKTIESSNYKVGKYDLQSNPIYVKSSFWAYILYVLIPVENQENVYKVLKEYIWQVDLETSSKVNSSISVNGNFTPFPKITRGKANYMTYNLQCKVGYMDVNSNYIDTQALIDEIRILPTLDYEMVLKNPKGMICKVGISGEPSFATNESVEGLLTSLSLEFTELGRINGMSIVNKIPNVAWMFTKTGVQPINTYSANLAGYILEEGTILSPSNIVIE